MDRRKKVGIIVIVCIAAVIAFEMFQSVPDGAAIFKNEGCINCHSFKGKGGELCPDLTAVTQRRTESWIRDQIHDPKQHNPSSMMPSFSQLSRREVTAIIKYLKS
jgi:cbb3-type cytochrome oxidase cytochrome c subunit